MNFAGSWRNAAGSGLTLVQSGDAVEGFYETKIGDDRALGKRHTLTGRVAGSCIGFVVNWSDSNSVTAWVGRLERDAATGAMQLHTMWHLVREEMTDQPRRRTAVWESFMTYASVFSRI